jgi:predicted nucleotidyltransferase
MKKEEIIALIRQTESPLKRQLLTVALVSHLLQERGKEVPIIIGGLALSYYTREVYFTADIDLAYSDRKALDEVLGELDFGKSGRYWVNEDLKIAIEVPVGVLVEEDSPLEIVEVGPELQCKIIGIEDLLIDRLNACKHWKSEIDCEMAELLVMRYSKEMDWDYLEKKAEKPENDLFQELHELKTKAGT